jgi:hypothetical protein
MVLTLAGALLAPMASARIARNTIDPLATITGNGRHLALTGPIECTPVETAFVRVTVTQRSTGALAEGLTLITCTGDTLQWGVLASTRGHQAFAAGEATATAAAVTRFRNRTTDSHQWLVAITLVEP